jgi:phosphoadenosine phosphosulfate reductase
MLVENTLWGQRDKVQIAIERLRQYEPHNGYYLAFSGGKDSITIHKLAELAGVQFDAHYRVTTVDPPELVKFIRMHYPHVARDRPEMSMFQLILYKKWPPMRTQRYCCEHLKEAGGSGRIVVTGVRWEESPRRAKRRMIEQCYNDGSKTYLSPIIDWTEHDVWEFIRQEQLEYCSLYDEGFDRIGCVLCPLARAPERDAARWPQFKRAYIKTFDKLIDVRNAAGLETSMRTGQEIYDWWTQRHTVKAPQEARLFD